MGMFKRGGVYYGRVKDLDGKWVKETLNTSDRVVALVRYRELERRTVAASDQGAHEEHTFREALAAFFASRRVKGCAAGTISMYATKARHLTTFFGENTPLVNVAKASRVDAYISRRLDEKAARNTIGKELTTLRGIFKVALRAELLDVNLDRVLPHEWATDYEPRRTHLTPAEVERLVVHLAQPGSWKDARGRAYVREGRHLERSAWVAFVVATGARFSEAMRARRDDVDLARGLVHFEITKTRKKGKREKYVPITDLTRGLLDHVLAATEGNDPLFSPWGNVNRDLEAACVAADVPVVTPNDLRRTHSNWLRDAGVDTSTIADVMGHTDSRMVERVYGRLRPEQLRDRVVRVVEGVH